MRQGHDLSRTSRGAQATDSLILAKLNQSRLLTSRSVREEM